jgi:hypothetical protein
MAPLALAQDKKAAPAGSPTDDPMMAKMMELATPGAAHKLLDPKVGKWNLKVISQMPGQPASESTATSEIKWIFDGRYMEETVQGKFGEMPFHGRGITGYDNLKKKYFSTWIDSFGTGIMVTEGTYDAGTKTFSFAGDMPDLMAGKYSKGRIVCKTVDNDHWTMQMFQTGPDGKEAMSMEIHYTRAK